MFENQKVYQKAIDFADNICAITSNFPKGYYFLRDQLNRAALSIAELKTAQIENDSDKDRALYFGLFETKPIGA